MPTTTATPYVTLLRIINEIIYFILRLLTQVIWIGILTFAGYGLLIAFVATSTPTETIANLSDVTPILLSAMLVLSALSWLMHFMVTGRAPFGRILPHRWELGAITALDKFLQQAEMRFEKVIARLKR